MVWVYFYSLVMICVYFYPLVMIWISQVVFARYSAWQPVIQHGTLQRRGMNMDNGFLGGKVLDFIFASSFTWQDSIMKNHDEIGKRLYQAITILIQDFLDILTDDHCLEMIKDIPMLLEKSYWHIDVNYLRVSLTSGTPTTHHPFEVCGLFSANPKRESHRG